MHYAKQLQQAITEHISNEGVKILDAHEQASSLTANWLAYLRDSQSTGTANATCAARQATLHKVDHNIQNNCRQLAAGRNPLPQQLTRCARHHSLWIDKTGISNAVFVVVSVLAFRPAYSCWACG